MADPLYNIFIVRAQPKGFPDRRNPFHAVQYRDRSTGAPTTMDSLLGSFGVLASLTGDYDDTRRGRLLSTTTLTPLGRTIYAELEAGPYGHAGKMKHRVSKNTQTYGVDDANQVPLRTMLISPLQVEYALLFVERIGRSSLLRDWETIFFKALGNETVHLYPLAVHVDLQQWVQFFDGAQATEVIVTYRSTRREDFDPASRRKKAAIVNKAVGRVARRVGRTIQRDLLDGARAMASNQAPARIEVRVPELTPRGEQLEQESVEIALQDSAGRVRRVIIENDELPPFGYEFSSDIDSATLQEVWTTHAQSILRAEHPLLDEAWKAGAWAANDLAFRIPLGDN